MTLHLNQTVFYKTMSGYMECVVSGRPSKARAGKWYIASRKFHTTRHASGGSNTAPGEVTLHPGVAFFVMPEDVLLELPESF